VVAFEERLVALEGVQLQSAVDVFVGRAALKGARWSEENARFEGILSGLGPGDYPVRVRMRDCTEHDIGHLIRVR
jgi:hypothetical protein